MKSLSTIIVVLLIATVILAQAQNAHFHITLSKPDFTIDIPEIPQIEMKAHPLAGSRPHARLMGSGSGYNVSVLTPTADAGMTALECASSQVKSVVHQEQLQQNQYSLLGGDDKSTYGMFFARYLDEGTIQLNAHLFSAASGTHCIDVHITVITTDKNDVAIWRRGMKNARVTPK